MQSKLDMFLNKKNGTAVNQNKKKDKKEYHDSSREHSQTEVMEPINDIPSEKFSKTIELCKLLILPGPSDSIYFPYMLQKLHKLKQNYNPINRTVFYNFIEENLKYERIENVEILRNLDDSHFLKTILPAMINLMITKTETVSACIHTLVLNNSTTSMITREQTLILLIAMFFGIMPKNPLCRTKSFGEFMVKREKQRFEDLKRQKLKFIINYFTVVVERMDDKEFISETITFQKSISNTFEVRQSLDTENYNRDLPMLDVDFCQNPDTKIQDFYGKAAMVDFANESIGGGALRSGCVQEEILFLIFPEAIISMLIAPEMQQNEAIIIYGLRRYSNYQNYSYSLKFDGPYNDSQLSNVNDSVMIAIDAINFSNKFNSEIQFKKENTWRQIVKAYTGFTAIDYVASGEMKICTGRWGCGAFKADQIWKFFIQWIACSQAGRAMIYTSDQLQIFKELKYAVKKLIQKTINTLDMFALMQSFMQIKQRATTPKDHTFIQYLKAHI